MSRDDEKTRLKVPAVKRRAAPDVSSVATRPAVRAVKRAVAKRGLEEALAEVDKPCVLRRGSLRNAGGGTEIGWMVRDGATGPDLFHFVPAEEPLLKSIARGLGKDSDIYFDVMQKKASVACLVLHGKATLARGTGELLDAEANEIAAFQVGQKLWAEVTQGAHPEPLVALKPQIRGRSHALAPRGRLVSTVVPELEGELVQRLDRYELSFQNGATPLERLLTVTAVALADAFNVRAEYRQSRNRNDNGLVFGVFFDRHDD